MEYLKLAPVNGPKYWAAMRVEMKVPPQNKLTSISLM